MKKFVSAIIVLAMVLAMLPAAAFAVSPLNDNTYNLTIGSSETIELFPMASVDLVVTTTAQGASLTVDGQGMYMDWYLDNGMQMFYPEGNGAYTMNLGPNATHTVKLVSDTGFDFQTLNITVEGFEAGTEENPEPLVMGENSTTVDGFAPYFFTYIASVPGDLTIEIDTDKCSDWSFLINVDQASGGMKYGDTNYSDVEPVISSETVSVKAGDVVTIMVATANFGNPGSIYFNASFVQNSGGNGGGGAGEGGEDIPVIGTVIDSATIKLFSETGMTEASQMKVVEYTASSEGTVYITMSSPEDGWSLLVYKNGEPITIKMSSSQTKTYEYPVYPGDVLKFEMGAYDAKVTWGPVDGRITYVISFDSGTVEIEMEPYIISDTLLYLGDNDLTMIETAENTLFEFTPDETGVYKFTAPAGILIGNWGQFFNPMDHTGDAKTNTIEWTCTDVGQSILIGVAGEEDIVLNVERTGDYVPAPVIDWTIYENKAELDYFEVDMDWDLLPVDVTDDVTDQAVLGTDGFYHLGNANGPILFVDLNQYIYPATGYGRVGYVIYDENGDIVAKISYNEAIEEYYGYSDGGIYPVTVDTIEFFKNYGSEQGWYEAEKNGFYLFGETTVDPETAWMFACYYDEDLTAFLSDYYVAGEAGLCGSTWTPGDEANQMGMNADGTCSITYNNVAPGKYMFKVTQTDWSMDNWGGDGPDGNYVIELASETYVTITFNPETGKISVATGENAGTGDHSIAGLVVAMLAATAGAVVLTKKKEF